MAGSDLTVSINAVTTNSNDKIHVDSVNTVSKLHVDICRTLGEGSLSSSESCQVIRNSVIAQKWDVYPIKAHE